MSTRANRTNRLRHVGLPVAESTATVERVSILETPTIEAPTAERPGRLLVQLIKAGWSLNGRYYSEAVLKRDGPAAFPAGTLNFIDHDTDDEAMTRPAGSLTRLASVQTTEAKWDPKRKALTAEVRIFAPWREAVRDWAQSGAIGMSIRAWAEGEQGTAEGRNGWIVSALTEGRSVDYVTKPAAGGAIVAVLESITRRPTPVGEARNIGVWLESRLHLALTQLGDDMYGSGRLTREERIALSSAIGDALKAWTVRVEADAPQLFERDLYDEPTAGASDASEAVDLAEAPAEEIRRALGSALRSAYANEGGAYVWVRDFDGDRGLVWYEQSNADDCRTWQEAYSIAATGRVELGGKRSQVVTRTVYDPVPASPGADAVVQTEAVTEDVTTGALPAAPTNPPAEESSVSGNQNTGPEPGAGGAANEGRTVALGEADRLSQLLAEQRTATAEANARADKEKTRADTAEAKVTLLEAQRAAETQTLAALSKSPLKEGSYDVVVARVRDSLNVGTDGKVDEAKLTTAIEAEIAAEQTRVAQLLESYGVGRVRGLGASEASDGLTEEAFEAALGKTFQGIGLDEKTAAAAAKGR